MLQRRATVDLKQLAASRKDNGSNEPAKINIRPSPIQKKPSGRLTNLKPVRGVSTQNMMNLGLGRANANKFGRDDSNGE
jgi:hypothetical protein